MGGVEADLVGDLRPFLIVEQRWIELVAKDAEERYSGPGYERRDPADLVVRDGGDMGSHRAERIGQRGAPLDLQPLDCVRVVARPALPGKGEQPGIETAT